MAAVTVFVDDAVLGRLPYVCVKTGAPAEGMLTMHTPVGAQTRLGVWWLLILAGPLGWLALFFIALSANGSNGETLTVQVPWTEAAQRERDESGKFRGKLWLVCIALVGLGFAFMVLTGGNALGGEMATVLWAAAGIVALVAVGSGLVANQASIDVRLDASRRWVTLGNVHDDFARAVEISRLGREPTTP